VSKAGRYHGRWALLVVSESSLPSLVVIRDIAGGRHALRFRPRILMSESQPPAATANTTCDRSLSRSNFSNRRSYRLRPGKSFHVSSGSSATVGTWDTASESLPLECAGCSTPLSARSTAVDCGRILDIGKIVLGVSISIASDVHSRNQLTTHPGGFLFFPLG